MAVQYYLGPSDVGRTHILIVGVGAYPYVAKMQQQVYARNEPFWSVRQLTSPVISAIAFWEAVEKIDRQQGWIAPLGSVEVLISAPPNAAFDPNRYNFSDPSRQNLEKAYQDWKERCDTHPDNISIFYYCGHGFSREDDYLLASDFLKNPRLPDAHAFNLQKTVRGFQSCQSKKKLFFIDACRSVSGDMLANNFNPLGLDGYSYLGKMQYCFTQQSTGPGMEAFGGENEVSNYTRALIRALSGQACEDNWGDGWPITTGSLGVAVNQILASIINPPNTTFYTPDFDIEQYCTQDYMHSFPIITYKEAPEVAVEVETVPFDKQAMTALSCYKSENDHLMCECAPQVDNWTFTVPAGIYAVVGQTVEVPSLHGRKLISARPPFIKPKLLLKHAAGK